MKVLGVSGSPIPNSNTDRALRAVLDAVGVESEFQFFMMEEGMNFVGSVAIQGNVPCVRCGNGDSCKMSGINMLYGADATVDSVGIKQFEEQPGGVAAARDLGRKIREALDARLT